MTNSIPIPGTPNSPTDLELPKKAPSQEELVAAIEAAHDKGGRASMVVVDEDGRPIPPDELHAALADKLRRIEERNREDLERFQEAASATNLVDGELLKLAALQQQDQLGNLKPELRAKLEAQAAADLKRWRREQAQAERGKRPKPRDHDERRRRRRKAQKRARRRNR